MKRHSILLSALVLFIVGAAMAASQVITPSDVEKVSGIKGIKTIPKNPAAGAGGDLNFARADGTIVLMVMDRDKAYLGEVKAQKGSFNAPVTGVGEEAYDGPGFGKVRYILAFRKGNRSVTLSSFMDLKAGGKPFFSQDQLKDLAKVALSRM